MFLQAELQHREACLFLMHFTYYFCSELPSGLRNRILDMEFQVRRWLFPDLRHVCPWRTTSQVSHVLTFQLGGTRDSFGTFFFF